ncbi:hypothetical protein ACFE04_008306 [Oxalis oulophora]
MRTEEFSSSVSFKDRVSCLLEQLPDFSAEAFCRASIIGIAIPVGAGICGLMVDRYGRKLTTLAVLVPSVLSWFLMYYTRPDQIYLIYFSRFLAGLSAGMGIVAAFYVSELSHTKYRAAFSGFLMLYASVGIVVISILQIFFTWQQTALICCIFFTILLILCIFYLPESPIWLAKFRSDLDGAKRTLRFLISNDEPSDYKSVYADMSEGVVDPRFWLIPPSDQLTHPLP